jgi:hypothetical protein
MRVPLSPIADQAVLFLRLASKQQDPAVSDRVRPIRVGSKDPAMDQKMQRSPVDIPVRAHTAS